MLDLQNSTLDSLSTWSYICTVHIFVDNIKNSGNADWILKGIGVLVRIIVEPAWTCDTNNIENKKGYYAPTIKWSKA